MSNCHEKNDKWIFYCGATDTITYDASDLTNLQKPQKSHIQGAGTVNIHFTYSTVIKLSLYSFDVSQIIIH